MVELKHEKRLTTIILAGGKGTRMKSPLPKVLHHVAGIPMIERIVETAKKIASTEIRVVVGHGQNLVKQVVEPMGAKCFVQTEQKGTADAVKSAGIQDLDGEVIILNGDHPLVTAHDLTEILRVFRDEKLDLAVATCEVESPGQLGRIVRQNGKLKAIVEAKDASSDTLKINEINTGLYVVRADVLSEYLPQIQCLNKQNEYYLTDLISLAVDNHLKVDGIKSPRHVAAGVNSQQELAKATAHTFQKKREFLMTEGVILIDPKSVFIEDFVQIGPGTVIYPNVFVRGRTTIGSFCVLEPNVFISSSQLQNSIQIRAGSYLEQCEVHSHCLIGPYARLRPKTVVGEEAHIGNFVELKNVQFGKKSKANHLAYLGDAEIGTEVNIGCGTITCNYAADKKKYKTKIGDRTFVGSDTQFVAPVEIGHDVVIGSGSTITKSVPDGSLAVTRAQQVIREGYTERLKKKLEGT
ncbi:MAG: bifunctional UDP-N-acetylglucosamine diphosphorylase/glucosamine-1-phosphate N-acetyltransferase GlmU [Pseudobdellovibrionaceae bacterium]